MLTPTAYHTTENRMPAWEWSYIVTVWLLSPRKICIPTWSTRVYSSSCNLLNQTNWAVNLACSCLPTHPVAQNRNIRWLTNSSRQRSWMFSRSSTLEISSAKTLEAFQPVYTTHRMAIQPSDSLMNTPLFRQQLSAHENNQSFHVANFSTCVWDSSYILYGQLHHHASRPLFVTYSTYSPYQQQRNHRFVTFHQIVSCTLQDSVSTCIAMVHMNKVQTITNDNWVLYSLLDAVKAGYYTMQCAFVIHTKKLYTIPDVSSLLW